MHKLFVIATAFLLLTACHTFKTYQQPVLPVPDTFRQPDNNTATGDSSSIATIPWKSFFTDTTLQKMIDTVLYRNYDLSIALNNIRQQEAYLKQARAAWLPAVSVNVSAGMNRFSDNSLNGKNGFNLVNTIGSNHLDDYAANLGVSWEADIWGKIRAQKAVALANLLQGEAAVKALRTKLIANTASAYYNLLMLHHQLTTARQNLLLSDSIVAMIRLQMENGAATNLAVQQAAVQRKKTAALIPALEQALYIQENALQLLMARAPAPIAVTADLYSFEIPARFSAGVPVNLLRRRPDVMESEFALRAAFSRTRIAEAEMYPALRINAAGGLNTFQSGNWLTLPASLAGNVIGSLVQPVFQQRRLSTQLKIRQSEYDQLTANFSSRLLQAVTEVADALVSTSKLHEKMSIAADQLALLQKAVPDARLLFSNGMADYLEVITVQQQLLQQQLDIADLKRQEVTTYIQLYRSLGGGTQ